MPADPVAAYQALTAARDALLVTLEAASSGRPRWWPRRLVVGPDGTSQPAHVAYERRQMLAAVNQLRAASNLPPATEAAVQRAELQACGHSDYAARYALYCAELVTGVCDHETGRYNR